MSASNRARYGVALRVVTELYGEVGARSETDAERIALDKWFEKGDRAFDLRRCEPNVDLVRKIEPEKE